MSSFGSSHRASRARFLSLIEPLEGRRLFSASTSPAAAKLLTPAAVTVAPAAVTADVQFSAPRGFYTGVFDLTLTTATPGATIRYTLDGSAPTASTGSVYGSPIHLTTTTVVRAIAAADGFDPSVVQTNTYLYLNDVIKQKKTVTGYPNPVVYDGSDTIKQTFDYEMDPKVVNDPAYAADLLKGMKAIPTLMVSVPKDRIFGSNGFYETADVEVPISFEYVDPAHPEDNTQQNAGIEGHADFRPKRSFRVSFKKIYGKGHLDGNLLQHAPVGGDTAADEIDSLVLRAGNNRAWATVTGAAGKTTFTEDEFARQQQIAMTGKGVHGQFVHLYINGLYWGLYNTAERPDEGLGEAYFGADKDNWFAINHDNTVKNGDPARWNYMVKTLAPRDMAGAANYAEMKQYLDVEQFADYMIGQSYAGVSDWPGNNWWAGGDTSTKMPFKFFVWDAEHQFDDGSLDVNYEVPNGAWLHPKLRPGNTTSAGIPPIILWRSLVKSPEFRLLLADRIAKAVGPGGALSDAESLKRFDTLNAYVRDAVIGESARWGDATGKGLRTRDGNWAPAVKLIRDLIPGNGTKLITEFRKYGYYPSINVVKTSLPTGLVDAGTKLTLTNPNGSGTIYYALDGTDPRLAGGGLSPSALVYNGSAGITLNANVKLFARVKSSSGEWSAATQSTYTLKAADPRNLRVTEMMYHPAGLPGSGYDGEDFEFLEFQNTGRASLNLAGIVVSGGIDFTFGDVTLAPGQFGVIIKSNAAFEALYGTGLNVLGTYSGKLDNKGERIIVTAPGNVTIADYTYADAWYPTTDGDGYSMVAADPTGDIAALNTAAGWLASSALNGTPGGDDLGINKKPTVDAGADNAVTMPDSIALAGSAIDATIPATSVLTTTWSMSSGPGVVTFADVSQPVTTAAFSVPGTYVLRLTASDGELSAYDDVTITVSPTLPPVNNASLSGFTFDDPNQDGIYNVGETKTSGKVVYLDTNNNGVRDAGEANTKTLADGNWSFKNLSAGVYHVRREFPTGYTYSTTLIDITLTAGQQASGLAIGSKKSGTTPPPPGTGAISGLVFWDNNKNGKQDSSDAGQAGKVVFLDKDNDGVLDSGEIQTTTDSKGNFTFKNVATGTYAVRRVLPKGYKVTTATTPVTLAAGQTLSGIKIGTAEA